MPQTINRRNLGDGAFIVEPLPLDAYGQNDARCAIAGGKEAEPQEQDEIWGGLPVIKAANFDGAVTEMLQRYWPDWQKGEMIGQGTYGNVYKITRREISGNLSERAVKVVEVGRAKSYSKKSKESYYRGVLSKMAREISVMEDLKSSCPNIVAINTSHYCRYSSGNGFMIAIEMEMLEEMLEHTSKMPELTIRESVRIAVDVCQALVACHSKGVRHRDVKPENIFWCERLGLYQLGDFGVAQQLDDDARSRGGSGSIAGTLPYMAPEVFRKLHGGSGAYSDNVDVYSLGMVLFYLLNDDEPPFEDDGKRLSGEKKLPDPEYGDDYLADLVRSATNPEPRYRLQSATAFLNALKAWPGFKA